MYVNFKFCNSKGQRLAVFARPSTTNPDQTLIWILKCSKKDPFSKRRAREVYYYWNTLGKAQYYTSVPKRTADGKIVKDKTGLVLKDFVTHEAHPEIITLDVPFQQERVNFYLRALYYKFIPKSRMVEAVKKIYDLALSQGKYIEK